MRTTILSIVFAMTFCLVSAQKTVEQMAQGVTNEMQKVLSLTDDQAADLYVIHLEKVKKIQAVKNDSSKSDAEKKEAMKVIYKAAFKEFLTVFDKDTLNEWFAHQKAKREKQKNK